LILKKARLVSVGRKTTTDHPDFEQSREALEAISPICPEMILIPGPGIWIKRGVKRSRD
jgi:hypothetical protein